MGQKINPNSLRKVDTFDNGGYFSNHWYSDFKYSALFYQDTVLRKTQRRLFMKYYKNRVRFLKGRRRRLKSILRMCSKSFSFLRLPYKINLLYCFYRPATVGLQRKYTAFIYKTKKKYNVGR